MSDEEIEIDDLLDSPEMADIMAHFNMYQSDLMRLEPFPGCTCEPLIFPNDEPMNAEVYAIETHQNMIEVAKQFELVHMSECMLRDDS